MNLKLVHVYNYKPTMPMSFFLQVFVPLIRAFPTFGTHEDERTVLFKTISLDGIKPNTNLKLTLALILNLTLTLN